MVNMLSLHRIARPVKKMLLSFQNIIKLDIGGGHAKEKSTPTFLIVGGESFWVFFLSFFFVKVFDEETEEE